MKNYKGHNSFESKIKSSGYIGISFIIAFTLICGMTLIRYLVPDFLNHSSWSFADQLNNYFFYANSSTQFNLGVCYVTFDSLLWFLNLFSTWIFARYLLNYLTYDKWFKGYLNSCAEVINSCDPSTFKDRVAILIPVCNDISVNTILQTAAQTYKCDVWLCDDSSKQDVITKLDEFAKSHNFGVIHRPNDHKKAHPSKIGNIYYFLSLHGNEYDYILETDSSSIVTSTFVENSLRFFNSPLIDRDRLSAMVCNGSFYPTNNFFSFVNAKQSQWTEAHMLNSSMRMGGSHVSYQGWGTIIKTSVLKQIPLEDVECSMCDIARGFYISRHGWNCYMNPFDFSGKIAQQNMYRWKNQRMKWAGGDAFIYKHLVFGKNFDDGYKTFFIHCWSFSGALCIPVTCIVQLLNNIFALTTHFVPIMTWSVIISIMILGTIVALPLIVLIFVWHANLLSFVWVVFSLIFEFAITFRRTYQLLIYGMIFGKWSSKKVTIKAKENLNFQQWLRSTLFDWCWIIGSLVICICISTCTNIPEVIVWSNLFTYFFLPSCLFIVASLFSYIKFKKGWNNDTVWYDIAANDFRYKFVKETDVWKKQHPVSK